MSLTVDFPTPKGVLSGKGASWRGGRWNLLLHLCFGSPCLEGTVATLWSKHDRAGRCCVRGGR